MTDFKEFLNVDAVDTAKDVLDALGIDLPEVSMEVAKAPQAREEVIGEATEYEQRIFAEMHRLKQEMEGLTKSVVADKLRGLADNVESMASPKELFDQLEGDQIDIRDQAKMSMLSQRFNMLHSLVHYILGERFMKHDERLGLRTKGRIVSTGSRY